MNKLQTKIVTYLADTYTRYEAQKKINHKYLIVSKALYKRLGKINKISNLDMLILMDKRLDELSFFFTDTINYEIPKMVYDVILDRLIYEGIQVNRITTPLDNDVSYELKLGAKLSMEELGFMIAFIIQEMDKSGHCAKEDMLKLVNKYLGK